MKYMYIYHICWGLPSGEVILIGGESTSIRTTTERDSEDGAICRDSLCGNSGEWKIQLHTSAEI